MLRIWYKITSLLRSHRSPDYLKHGKLIGEGIEESSTLNFIAKEWAVDDVAMLLRDSVDRHTFFDRISAKKLARVMKILAIPDGTVIIRQGKPGTKGLFLILEGHVGIERAAHGVFDSQIITVAGPGEIVGEMQLLDGEPRSATCVARGDLQMAVLSPRDFQSLPRNNPGGAILLSSIISRQQTARLRRATFKSLFLESLMKISKEELDL